MQTEEDFLAGLSTHPSKAELKLIFQSGETKYSWVELKIDDLPALEFGGYKARGVRKALGFIRHLKEQNTDLKIMVTK